MQQKKTKKLEWRYVNQFFDVVYTDSACPHCGYSVFDRLTEKAAGPYKFKCGNCIYPCRIGPYEYNDIVETEDQFVDWLAQHKIILWVGESLPEKRCDSELTLAIRHRDNHGARFFFIDDEYVARFSEFPISTTKRSSNDHFGVSHYMLYKMGLRREAYAKES